MSEKVIINVEIDKETVGQLIHAMKMHAGHVEDGIQENLIKLLQDIESGAERKCAYKIFVDDDGEPYDDWESDCGHSFTCSDEYMQPFDEGCNYCTNCGGKIEVVKKVVDDE